MTDEVILSDAVFDEKTGTGNWLVDFWAPWCGPCKAMGPILDEIATEQKGILKVGKMNVDENPTTPPKFGVMSIPTMVFLKDGKEVGRKIGAISKESVMAEMEKAFGGAAGEEPGMESTDKGEATA